MQILRYFKNPLSKFTRNPISLSELNNRMSNPDFKMKFDIPLSYTYPVDCIGGNECFETGEYNIQRNLCWSLEKKQEYIESLFKGTHQGVFVFVYDRQQYIMYCVDGKQRLNCISDFFNNKFALNINGKACFQRDIDEGEWRSFKNTTVLLAYETEMNSNEITPSLLIESFLGVNHKGVPQDLEHLEKLEEILYRNDLKLIFKLSMKF